MVDKNLSSILSFLVFLLGARDNLIISLVIIVVFDYITGVLVAIKNKKLNSKIGFYGLIKKMLYFLAVALGVTLDRLTGTNGICRNMIIYLFVANDSISILENLGKYGIKLPEKIKEILEQIKEENK